MIFNATSVNGYAGGFLSSQPFYPIFNTEDGGDTWTVSFVQGHVYHRQGTEVNCLAVSDCEVEQELSDAGTEFFVKVDKDNGVVSYASIYKGAAPNVSDDLSFYYKIGKFTNKGIILELNLRTNLWVNHGISAAINLQSATFSLGDGDGGPVTEDPEESGGSGQGCTCELLYAASTSKTLYFVDGLYMGENGQSMMPSSYPTETVISEIAVSA